MSPVKIKLTRIERATYTNGIPIATSLADAL